MLFASGLPVIAKTSVSPIRSEMTMAGQRRQKKSLQSVDVETFRFDFFKVSEKPSFNQPF